MLLRRCLILLSIFICYALNSTEAVTELDCRTYPFHPSCRGVQTKKRGQRNGCPEIPRRSMADMGNAAADNDYEKSRLWAALLEGGLSPDMLYKATAIARHRGNNRRAFETEDDVIDTDY